jgi:hypothetical protein
MALISPSPRDRTEVTPSLVRVLSLSLPFKAAILELLIFSPAIAPSHKHLVRICSQFSIFGRILLPLSYNTISSSSSLEFCSAARCLPVSAPSALAQCLLAGTLLSRATSPIRPRKIGSNTLCTYTIPLDCSDKLGEWRGRGVCSRTSPETKGSSRCVSASVSCGMSTSLDIIVLDRVPIHLAWYRFGWLSFFLGKILEEFGILNWEEDEDVYVLFLAASMLPLATYLLWYGCAHEEFRE